MVGTAERDVAGLQAPRDQDKAYLEKFLGTFSLKNRNLSDAKTNMKTKHINTLDCKEKRGIDI